MPANPQPYSTLSTPSTYAGASALSSLAALAQSEPQARPTAHQQSSSAATQKRRSLLSRSAGGNDLNLNLTSMIDVVFLLIIFFVLTAQISSVETAQEIELAQPPSSAAIIPDEEHRVIINLIPDESDRSKVDHLSIGYSTFNISPAGLATLTDDLRQSHQKDPSMKINLRADRAAAYVNVYPILQAAIKSGTSDVELVVSAPEQSSRPTTNNSGS